MGKKARKKAPKEEEEDLSMSGGDDNDADEIDNFYKERDDNLRTALSKVSVKKPAGSRKSVSWALGNGMSDDEQDEVLAFDDDDDDDDENDYAEMNDEEEEEMGEEEIDGNWGASKKIFYNEDAEGDEEDAKLEEEEAMKIQDKYYKMVKVEDFGFELFKQKPLMKSDEEIPMRRHIVLPDNLLDLSVNDRLQLVRDQSPELETLCNEFKTIFDDLKIFLLPLMQLINETCSLSEFERYSSFQFVRDVFELYLVYCSYLSLYLTMKSNDSNIGQHPILNEIEQYRKLIQFVDDDFQRIKPDILKIRELLQDRKSEQQRSKPITTTLTNGKSTVSKKKPSLRERMSKRVEAKQQQENGELELNDDSQINGSNQEGEEQIAEKRPITYQIQKNKGLTIKRKKEYRNPRVRHRNKYARALVKRKSRVPTARTEEQKYTGEATGIRAGLKRGIKLKC